VIAIIYTSLVAADCRKTSRSSTPTSSGRPYGLPHHGDFPAGTTQGVAGGGSRWSRMGIVSGALFLCVGIGY